MFPDFSNAKIEHAAPVCNRIVRLQDHHIARIAAAALQVARRRRVLLHRLHDFQEFAANGKDRVDQTEHADGRIAIGHFEAQNVLEHGDMGLEVLRDQRDLT